MLPMIVTLLKVALASLPLLKPAAKEAVLALRVTRLRVALPWFSIPPPLLPAELLEIVTLVTVSVPLLSMPPPEAATWPWLMLRPLSTAMVFAATARTEKFEPLPPPAMVIPAAGPLIVIDDLRIFGSPLRTGTL